MTKNKESNSGFDIEELIRERQLVDKEVIDELNHYPTTRTEALLLTNYVENIIKDCVAFLVKSNEARKIPRDTVKKILLDRGIIDMQTSKDIDRTFQIRDQYGHTMRLFRIENEIEPIMMKMNVVPQLRNKNPDWDKLEIDQRLTEITYAIIDNLQSCFQQLVNHEYHSQNNGKNHDDK